LLTWLLTYGQEDFTLHAGIDSRILLFAIFLSMVAGVLFGLAPAIQVTKVDLAPALKESRVAGSRVRRLGLPFGPTQMLIAGQIALSVLLVVAAALFVKTLINLHSTSIGFNTEKLLVFNLNGKLAGYSDRRGTMFYENLRQRFANLPGVRCATMSDIPLVSGPKGANSIIVPGMSATKDLSAKVAITVHRSLRRYKFRFCLGAPLASRIPPKRRASL
jgi:macrolide transport system ATP-binding/permease protein